MTSDTSPCNACGSPVKIVEGRAPNRLGARGQVIQVRRCTSPDCRTNQPSIRRLGDTV